MWDFLPVVKNYLIASPNTMVRYAIEYELESFDPETKEMVDSDKRMVTLGLKTTCLAEIRNTTNQLLQPTDYYIIRNAAEQLEIPESVSTHRAAIVTESTRLQEAIPAVTTVEELIEVMSSANWPRTN